MANRARDWTSLRQANDATLSKAAKPRFGSFYDRCSEHGVPLLENGWDGEYLCPQCSQHLWEEAHDSEEAWSEAFILQKLYGRNHRRPKSTEEDLRPWTVSTYQQLRRRVRKYAKEVLRIRGAAQMDLEPLLPFIGKTPGEQWERLRGFERRHKNVRKAS